MAEKMRKVVLLLLFCALFLWLGFRTGEIYNRTRKGFQAEKVEMRARYFYIVEEVMYGPYRHVNFTEARQSDPIIKILFNEKMRPILKNANIKVYTSEGERIY